MLVAICYIPNMLYLHIYIYITIHNIPTSIMFCFLMTCCFALLFWSRHASQEMTILDKPPHQLFVNMNIDEVGGVCGDAWWCHWFPRLGGFTSSGWWFGTSILFSHMLGIIIPIDFHIFQRGFKPPTSHRMVQTINHVYYTHLLTYDRDHMINTTIHVF